MRDVTLTADRVLLSKVGGVEEMVCCFLKGGQHQDALLHFGQAEPGDPQNLPLCGHKTARNQVKSSVSALRTCL